MLIHHHPWNHSHLLRSEGDSHSRPMRRFYLSTFLHDFGFAMTSMFVMFYLYQLGWSLPFVFGYLAVGSVFKSVFRHWAAWLMISRGSQRLTLIGSILWVPFVVSLLLLGGPGGWGYALLAAVIFFEAASHSTYYMAWDFNFVSFENKEKAGRQTSLVWIVGDFSRILAPLAGGLIAQVWRFEISLAIAGVLMLLSVVPLLKLKSETSITDPDRARELLKPKGLWQSYQKMQKAKLGAFLLSNIAGLAVGIWALYLAIAVFADKAYGGLGILFAASAIFSMFLSWLVGQLVDRGKGHKVLVASSLLESLTGGLRWFVTGIPQAVAHNFLQQQQSGHTLALFRWYFDKTRPAAERPSFFQAYAYIHDLTFALISGSLVVLLLVVPAQSQLDVLRIACIVMGVVAGLVISGLALTRAFRQDQR